MLRISKGTTADAKFQTNYKNAKAAGLKVGVYCYSLAQNAAQAKAEGDKVLNECTEVRLSGCICT